MVDKMIYSVIFYLGNTNPGVAQLVACLTGGQEAAGSNPVTRTKFYSYTKMSCSKKLQDIRLFGLFFETAPYGFRAFSSDPAN